MTAPIVGWYNLNQEIQTNWDANTIDNGSSSQEFTFRIWNNFNGSTAVSNMTNCVITTRDTSGGLDGSIVVKERWVKVRVDSSTDTNFYAIGSQLNGQTYEPVEHQIVANDASVKAGEISGDVNTGDPIANKANYAQVTLKIDVPIDALAGRYDFYTRVRYSFT